jgi:peptidoglycan/LPS O-acetylase OafA/YrhL
MTSKRLSKGDSEYLKYLRGISIFGIVLGHLCGWVYMPYSDFLFAPFVPIFFFISGSVSIYSYNSSSSVWIYYKKRMVSLLIPYYLICIFSLTIYILINLKLPVFNFEKLYMWLQITPEYKTMPFNLGQVWFLHTLVVISIISPLYFKLHDKSRAFIILIVAIILIICTIQLFYKLEQIFWLGRNNLYKPLTNSIFYLFGLLYFSETRSNRKLALVWLFFAGVILSITLVLTLHLDIEPSSHAYSPDLYYISSNLSAIAVVLIFQNRMRMIVDKMIFVQIILKYLYRHTYSIFLLHSFAIFISETVFKLSHPQHKLILYGVTKLAVVLMITCLLVIPFSGISNFVTKKMIKVAS